MTLPVQMITKNILKKEIKNQNKNNSNCYYKSNKNNKKSNLKELEYNKVIL